MRIPYVTMLKLCVRASVAVLALGLSSCCETEKVAPWTPKPRVQWGDIAIRPIAPAVEGYKILKTEPTRGLFPASIAVTRVAVEPEGEEVSRFRKRLLRDPRNEFLRWNAAFDDQMAVSEVFPIDHRDLGGADGEPEQVLSAFYALHARIGFIYAVNELSESRTEMFGVLYDVGSAEPVASIHAQAASIIPPEEEDESPDLWETDSRALVRAEFEHRVYDCIRELILQDEPAVLEAPTGWTPAGPILPVEWPPRRFEGGW